MDQIIPSADIDFDMESESQSKSYDDNIKQPQLNATKITEEQVTKGLLKQPVLRQVQKQDTSNKSSGKVQDQVISEIPKFTLQQTQKKESFSNYF